MYINQVYELSVTLDHEHFYDVVNAAYSRSSAWIEDGHEYADYFLTDKGVTVKYRNSRYKKKVKLIVNTNKISQGRKLTPEELTHKMEKCILKYFNHKFLLDDFTLSRMLTMTNIDIGSRSGVSAYINVLQRIGKVKGFSPAHDNEMDSSISFSLTGNSNGIHVLIYDLHDAIKAQLRNLNDVPEQARSLLNDADGVLRIEIGLLPKAIRGYTDEPNIRDQIESLSINSEEIFLDTLMRIIPVGDFYKRADSLELVRQKIGDRVLQRKMIQLITLIPERKSLLLAQKAMNYRRIDDVMAAFEKIDLSPVTIGKRQSTKYLQSIYSLLA